ncbi:hypothetical protein GOBAR_DD30437 [Gossypium barbadense]|nr:hypothetical protein GOBAR_DD30437 [Gossypium barbadense]
MSRPCNRLSLEGEGYNIIPVHNLDASHPCVRYPEVRAVLLSLRSLGNLREPPYHTWHPSSMDLLDWLGLFFGFQHDNVKNQREHLVLHLANAHMRLSLPPVDNNGTFQAIVLREFRRKLLENYTNWCSYLGKASNVDSLESDTRRELLYVGLYLLIWGESANLRFMPECICYIFHHMAMELNKILEDYIDEETGRPWIPSISGENAFLNRVVKPIYDTIKAEVAKSKNGTALHDTWRNYDDFNEYFWSKSCFYTLNWPLDFNSKFTSERKTGFVERRTFWNVYRSFDRLWVMLFLFLHVMVILAWEEKKYPWLALDNKDVKVRVLSLFITWSGMRLFHALLEPAMEFSRVSRQTSRLVLRMVLRILVAAAWTGAFLFCYTRIWVQRNHDKHLSNEANQRVWYSFYSPFVGAATWLLQLLGEIRNIEQLRWRFRFFATAIQFNLLRQEEIMITGLRWRFRFFATAIQFNLLPQEEIMITGGSLREKLCEAIHQVNVRCGLQRPFKMVELESNLVKANEFALIWNEIVTTFREEDIISDEEVGLLQLPPNSWEIRNEYRRCAVIETYDCVKYLMLHKLIKSSTEEHSILKALFQEIDHSIEIEKFTKTFRMIALLQIHARLIKLVELLLEPNKNVNEIANAMQSLYEIVVPYLFKEKRTVDQLREDGLAPKSRTTMAGLLFENAVESQDPSNKDFYMQVKRLHTILTTRDSIRSIHVNNEARRRLAFFSNSLFMKMPRAPRVEEMIAFSVLTPFNDEAVLYSKKTLKTKNEDGISILYYLQTIYDYEWKNFIERMRREGMVTADEIWTTKLRDLRIWASYRGQTFARTVRSMMYYYRALQLLAFLDSSSETDITVTKEEEGIALMKYTYVVSCQKYWEHKAIGDPRAEEIIDLLKHNESLRMAYIDQVSTESDEKEYYSVLVKYDRQLQREVEIYRIKLPGPMNIGEGKPENQNHGIVFTRGDAVQTIDMNQGNYFEEALKIRNLLEEFKHHHGIHRPTILGVREHIFSGSVSSVAWFMSAQETSFVTLFQRLFANPLKIRMRYGHPDMFDRLWFMTRGGLSKASKVINISEDIFTGFNCTLRGGSVTHHEYVQVGKGRDLGLNQISTFEAKIACGSGEQFLSRDVYRLVIVLSVYGFLWGQLYLALSGVENFVLGNDTNSKKALSAVINQELIIQFGLFMTLPAILESSVESGFLEAIWEFLVMQLYLHSTESNTSLYSMQTYNYSKTEGINCSLTNNNLVTETVTPNIPLTNQLLSSVATC